MSKKILILPVVAVVILVGVAVKISLESNTKIDDSFAEPYLVSITMSSSRPGCENINACYVPPETTIKVGGTVTWINDDSAFHTVTSGYYDTYDGVFDSGQLDPAQKFSYEFDEEGDFHYYCKLHPWMEGKVIVR